MLLNTQRLAAPESHMRFDQFYCLVAKSIAIGIFHPHMQQANKK